MPLFSFSVEKRLYNVVPLLMPQWFELCKNYILQLQKMGQEGRQQVRQNVTDKFTNPETGEFGIPASKPKYRPPPKSEMQGPQWRADNGDIIPMFHQIRRINPTMLNRPKVAQRQPPTLDQITASLSAHYKSVSQWSDAEKVAVFFGTPDRIREAMPSVDQSAQQPQMRMVATNWWQMAKRGTDAQ